VRSAVWRGPVVADSATVSWLLPQPIARGPLLLPRLASSATVSALLGMVSGALLGFLIANVSGPPGFRSLLRAFGPGWVPRWSAPG
jgi:hypothetical protein